MLKHCTSVHLGLDIHPSTLVLHLLGNGKQSCKHLSEAAWETWDKSQEH